MKNILAISGSTRKDSTNQHLIKAITGLTKERFTILHYDRIAMLPHFNPDQMDDAGTEVNDLRELIKQSDAILICTPEYAHGVPGSLKNAIDWTVGTSDFSGKLVMLLTASSDGKFGHSSLLETLRVIEAILPPDIQLLIPFAKTKIHRNGVIIDEQTLEYLKIALNKLDDILTEHNAEKQYPLNIPENL
jgi:chromate reductase, NAD(P)H dehydrogenase (quinone)